jgi:hypothetical protein
MAQQHFDTLLPELETKEFTSRRVKPPKRYGAEEYKEQTSAPRLQYDRGSYTQRKAVLKRVNDMLNEDAIPVEEKLIELLRDPLQNSNQLGGETRESSLALVVLEGIKGSNECTQKSITLDGLTLTESLFAKVILSRTGNADIEEGLTLCPWELSSLSAYSGSETSCCWKLDSFGLVIGSFSVLILCKSW